MEKQLREKRINLVKSIEIDLENIRRKIKELE